MSHDLRISARTETQNKFKIEGGSKLEVFDEDGKLLHKGEFKSFTSNFLKLLYGSMIGAGTAKAKDLTNTDLPMDSFPQNTFNISGGADVKKFGVVVGTNTAAVSVSDYNITVPAGLTVNDTVVSASSVGVDSISVEISRQISNTSGLTVNLKEAGLICGSEDEVSSNVLIARDLLDITLENDKKSVWRYTINFNFANDVGGFVKTFVDKMFNGLFREMTASAGWTPRASSGAAIYANKMWVFGGYNGSSYLRDVWYSTDGITWTQATASAGWAARGALYCALTYKDKLWIFGGEGENWVTYNDVWYSTDGITWTRATASAGWAGRNHFVSCVYDGKMWIMGGLGQQHYNDVWYSTDGITWTQATASAGWAARRGFCCIVYDGKMWIMGGRDSSVMFNDVWYSSDGTNWTRATASAGWAARPYFSVVTFNNKMWVLFNNPNNDVWYSTDGVNWIKAVILPSKFTRNSYSALVFKNKIWVMGGDYGTTRYDDVYSTKLLTAEIIPGTSDSAFSATATALGSLIADGNGSGELVYSVMPGAGTTEPTVSGNKTKMSITREFTNNSGADITVREVGLFSGSDMLARLILANPVTIPNGQSDVITVDFETEV